jgi:hypothetical protein
MRSDMAVKEPSESAFRGGERRLLEQLGEIEARLARLEEDVSPWTVYINSFAPEPYDLRKPIPVLLRQVGDEDYEAVFLDAGVSTSGDTPQEAFDNLKSLILDSLDSLLALPADRLGRRPSQQLTVLKDFINAATGTSDHKGACGSRCQEVEG